MWYFNGQRVGEAEPQRDVGNRIPPVNFERVLCQCGFWLLERGIIKLGFGLVCTLICLWDKLGREENVVQQPSPKNIASELTFVKAPKRSSSATNDVPCFKSLENLTKNVAVAK